MGSQKSIPWDQNGVFWLVDSKITHNVCSAHQNVMLLVDTMDWDLTYKDLIKMIVCNPESNKCMTHRCESCPGTTILKEFLDQKLNEHEDDEEFNYCQWDTADRATLTTIIATYEEYKETLIDVIEDLTRYSYIAKCQVQYLKWQERLLGKWSHCYREFC